MSDTPVWTRDEIESPCVRICVIHPDVRICAGCYRTIDEIRLWAKMSAEERADIMAALPDRATLLKKRRGGRGGRMRRK